MCFRLRRIRDLLAVEEGEWPHQHEGCGRREELKGAWAWYEEQVPDVLYCTSCMGGGFFGGGVMMAEGSGTDHTCTVRSPRSEGGWGSKRTPFEPSWRCGVADFAPSAGYGLYGLAQLTAGWM
jgi:hypothetical protein